MSKYHDPRWPAFAGRSDLDPFVPTLYPDLYIPLYSEDDEPRAGVPEADQQPHTLVSIDAPIEVTGNPDDLPINGYIRAK